MKKVLIGLLVLGSISSFASGFLDCKSVAESSAPRAANSTYPDAACSQASDAFSSCYNKTLEVLGNNINELENWDEQSALQSCKRVGTGFNDCYKIAVKELKSKNWALASCQKAGNYFQACYESVRAKVDSKTAIFKCL